MRNKSLFLLLACVCGTVAAIGVSKWMEANTGNAVLETVEIFVTTQAISAQEEITADKIKLEHWPANKVPQGSSNDLAELQGRYAKQSMYAGEIVMAAKLMNEKDDVIVPQGFRVVPMPAGKSGIANLVKQGDRVDVDAYFTKSDLIPASGNKPILVGVKVFAIDGKTKRDPDEKKLKSARTISLLIRKADYDAWVIAQQNGEVSLSMGSTGTYSDDLPEEEASAEAQAIVTWIADHKAHKDQMKAEALAAEKAKAAADAAAKAKAAESGEPEPVSRKGVFRTTKIVEGRLVVYEWTPGDPVPRVVADTGPGQLNVDLNSLEETPPATDEEASYLNGEGSPFFQPGE